MMKQILRKACLAALGGVLMSTSAWGQEAAGSYTYFLDFETVSGTTATASQGTAGKLDATIKGSGSFATDPQFGGIFKNAMGGMRTNYLLLPTDVLSHSADSKELTIAFWVNRSEQTADYFHCPIFTAYAVAPNNGNGEPMLRCAAKGEVQLNVSSTVARDEGWCDFGDALNVNINKKNQLSTVWLDDSKWHYYTITLTETSVKVYVDGVIFNEWHLDNASAGQKITRFFTEGSKYTYICLGGNQAWDWPDKDPGFTFDDLYITNKALTAGEINYRIFSKNYSTFIADNKGDLTSIINGTFEENAEGWSGGTWRGNWDGFRFSWRGNSEPNYYYEICDGQNGILSYKLTNMPVGKYKVVAAAHASKVDDNFTITPSVAGTSGTPMKAKGCWYEAGNSEINTNGVQMPNCNNVGGFTEDTNVGRNWQWISATGELTSVGDLTISFTVAGNKDGAWMSIDDVHLYCTELDGTSYTVSAGTIEGNKLINTNNGTNANRELVTCDLIVTNPNAIIRTSGRVTTAAGAYLNNNKYSKNQITKLVLYDGYSYEDYIDGSGDNIVNPVYDYGAILYRNIPAGQWCTLVVPFYPTNLDEMKVPASFANNVLTFTNAPTTGMNNEPMIVKSTNGLTAITGFRNSTYGITYGDMISGEGLTMKGTYSTINAVPEGSYVLARVGEEDGLYQVNSTVGLHPFRAYFTAPTGAPALINLSFDGEGTTGISSIDNAQPKNDNIYYDLSGRRVAQPTKGLYIVNGKKVVIK
jgi:hypothetical protein